MASSGVEKEDNVGSGNAQPVSRMESFGWRLRESANFSQLAADIWLPAHSNHVQQQKSDMRTLDTESCNIDAERCRQ